MERYVKDVGLNTLRSRGDSNYAFTAESIVDAGGVAGAELLMFHHPLCSVPAACREVDLS